MTIIGIDDTDSREDGMCTTYVAHKIASELERASYTVRRLVLFRLNPAVPHKTRGNAAIAVHTDAPAVMAFNIAKTFEARFSKSDNGAVVVFDGDTVPDRIRDFAQRAVTDIVSIDAAVSLIDDYDLSVYYDGNGRGRIGSVAAIGAYAANDDWTYEYITYRSLFKRGLERQVDVDTVFELADEYYPKTWDTVDRKRNKPVCIPNAPGPILYGIRGDEKTAVVDMGEEIEVGEPIESSRLFVTNQGTDMHVQDVGSISMLTEDSAYQVSGDVTEPPVTKEGGHVMFAIADDTGRVDVMAFEPTKHFRDVVRKLRVGDSVTVVGEYDCGTIKLEKLRVDTVSEVTTNPACPSCENSMKSAGADQGYRCRDCGEISDSPDIVDRELSRGWYEVPPCARRHIAKPLVRGGFDMPTNPFR